MNLNYISYAEAQQEGYIPYAGPYKPQSELWMIERAIYDILTNGRDKYAIVKHGSQVDIYILPNFYLTTTFHGQPWTRLHGDEDQSDNAGLPAVAAEAQAETSSETVWAATLEEVANPVQSESELAQEVFESEGGTLSPADTTEGI
jgi:hypothetical protein